MKSKYQHILPVIAIGLVIVWMPVSAAADGMIVPVRPEIRVRGAWAVKYHHVNVMVRDQVAAVSIDQEFVNTGKGAIEVEYLFPVPPGAAIDSMTLVVDGKEFAAKLLKADEARKIYEDIVRRKKDPALLEYVGFGLYKTRAFPLQPGKPCKVIVTYKNVCKKDRDLVEVWYPLNTEKFSAKPIESVRVKVDIKTKKVDIGPVYSPTHSLQVDRRGPRHVIATYEAKKALPTSDLQVFYKAANEKIGATLLTHQGNRKKNGHFMLLVSPSPRIAGTSVVAKDLVVVFDHSGSMSGEKIEQAKDALRHILKNLNSEDRFNVVAYNDSSTTFFSRLVPANEAKIAEALDMVDRIEATGGTNIHEALQMAMNFPKRSRTSRPAYVIFLTDGAPTVGKTNEKDILADTKEANKVGARLFAFGVGYQPNVRLLDKLVAENDGRSDYVRPKEPIEAKVSSLYNKIKNPVMTDLKVELQGVRLKDMYPRKLGDLFDGDQIVVVGRYDCRDAAKLPKKRSGVFATTLVVKGIYQGNEKAFEYNVGVRKPGKDMRYVFVEKIWAIRRVGWLLDEIQLRGKSKELIDELIRLSQTYGIMTPYTSFLADDRGRVASADEVRRLGKRFTDDLALAVVGEKAQRGAVSRRMLNDAKMVPATPSIVNGRSMGVAIYGNTNKDAYEQEKVEYVAGLRNVGNLALYRRGRVWMTAEAAKLDPKKDADKITTIKRYSKAYFELARRNTVAENQVMASQRANEVLRLKLRGTMYNIE